MMDEDKEFLKDDIFSNEMGIPPSHQKQFRRSKSNVVIAGVCSGIANYFKFDVGYIRLAAILTMLFGEWSAIIYLVVAFLLPSEKVSCELSEAERVTQKKENFRTVGGGVLIFAGIYFGFSFLGLNDGGHLLFVENNLMFPVMAFLIGIYLWVNNSEVENAVSKIYPLKFVRCRKNRLFLGVCSGFAEYLQIDKDLIRLTFVIASLLTFGLFAVTYFIIFSLTQLERENSVDLNS